MTKGAVTEGAKGDGSNPTLRKFAVMLTGLRRDVDTLKKAVVRAGATTLDGLRDVEVLYDHWTDLPRHGQPLRWDKTRESRFHGLATFADPTAVSDYFTVPVTGAGTFGLSEFLVDTDWDLDRPCLATATVVFNGGYTDQEVDPPTSPATFIAAPQMLATMNDRGTGYVTTPGAGYEAASDRVDLGSQANEISLAWLFLRGRPKVNVNLTVSADQFTGITGAAEILVVTRVTRL